MSHYYKGDVRTSDALPPGYAGGFLTDSLPLASYLLSKGHEPSLQASGGRLVLFAFQRTSALDRELAAFNNGQALVEPVAYNAARITLRRRMDALRGAGR